MTSIYAWPDGKPVVRWWRSVFEGRAPNSMTAVATAGGGEIGRGTMALEISEKLMTALYDAYTEATTTTSRALT
jgi:hypothetical protein